MPCQVLLARNHSTSSGSKMLRLLLVPLEDLHLLIGLCGLWIYTVGQMREHCCTPGAAATMDERCTVPLKGKLTVSTRSSRLDARVSKFESLEFRVSRIESRVSSIESRGSRNKAISNIHNSKKLSRKRFISRVENKSCSHIMYKCFAATMSA